MAIAPRRRVLPISGEQNMKTENRKNAPQWFNLRDEVLASIGLLNGALADQKTLNVMCAVTRALMNKQALPEKLAGTFLECIRRRTRHTDFTFDGEIRLTHNQWKHARKTGRDKVPGCENGTHVVLQLHPEDERDALLDAFQRYFIHLSTTNQPDFIQLSSVLGAKPAQMLEFWWRNTMKSNEINHEPDMIFASPPMRLAGSPDVHDRQTSINEPAAPEINHVRTDGKLVGEGVQDADGRVVRPAKWHSDEIAISFFQSDTLKPASANIEIFGEKWHLNFATADFAEDKFFPVSSPEWKLWYGEIGGNAMRAESRAYAAEGSPMQYLMSPIYRAGDKFGKQTPLENAVAVIGWEAKGVPINIAVVINSKMIFVPMTRFSYGEKSRPTFKGHLKIAREELLAAA
eukprot:gene1781-1811_t